jgi:hypothetical protein
MAARTDGSSGDGDGDTPSARAIELARRLIASAAGLPRVCALKRCRRKKRCLGADLICVHHHEGLLRKRYASALARLGWEKQNLPRTGPGTGEKGT